MTETTTIEQVIRGALAQLEDGDVAGAINALERAVGDVTVATLGRTLVEWLATEKEKAMQLSNESGEPTKASQMSRFHALRQTEEAFAIVRKGEGIAYAAPNSATPRPAGAHPGTDQHRRS
jgi:hypothetical protein